MTTTIDASDVKKLVVACDAGMGSSVMLASTLKGQLKKSGITVEHTPVERDPRRRRRGRVPPGAGRPRPVSAPATGR